MLWTTYCLISNWNVFEFNIWFLFLVLHIIFNSHPPKSSFIKSKMRDKWAMEKNFKAIIINIGVDYVKFVLKYWKHTLIFLTLTIQPSLSATIKIKKKKTERIHQNFIQSMCFTHKHYYFYVKIWFWKRQMHSWNSIQRSWHFDISNVSINDMIYWLLSRFNAIGFCFFLFFFFIVHYC